MTINDQDSVDFTMHEIFKEKRRSGYNYEISVPNITPFLPNN